MKNVFLFSIVFAAVIAPGLLKAQYAIPNGSFENWTSVNKPANWTVFQAKPTQGHLFRYVVIDSAGNTDSTTDSVYLEMYAKDGASFIDMPMQDTASPCIISQKFPMTLRPEYFSMNYAYVPETRYNQFQVSFIFTRWDTITKQEDTLLAGAYNSKPGHLDSAWTTLLFTHADLASLYNPNFTGNPDTATITITSSLQSSPFKKTALAIDEIYFTDTAVTAGVKLREKAALPPPEISVFPNPFSDKAIIKYDLAQGGQVSLNIYDLNGKKVSEPVQGNQVSGAYEVVLDGSGLKNGVYYYLLQTANQVYSGKLICAK